MQQYYRLLSGELNAIPQAVENCFSALPSSYRRYYQAPATELPLPNLFPKRSRRHDLKGFGLLRDIEQVLISGNENLCFR